MDNLIISHGSRLSQNETLYTQKSESFTRDFNKQMPRGRRYDHPSASTAAQHAGQRLLSRSNDFKKGINTIHKYNVTMAESLSHGGPIESSLNAHDPEHQTFLQTQRERLKQLAEQNVNSMYLIQDMLDSVQSVGDQVEQDSSEGKSEEDGVQGVEDEKPSTDYKALIEAKLKEKAEERSRKRSNVKNEAMMRECLERLGEKTDMGRDDDDDELEVVTQHDTSNDAALKCPITGQIFKNPYRNKVCNHVYDYDAILSHLRLKRHCPITGCQNARMDKGQLEEDFEMKMKVHRYMKRQEQEDRLKMSQQYEKDYEEEEEEEEEEDNNGTTLIC